MKRDRISTDRLWCLFLVLAVSQIAVCGSKNINQVKLLVPAKESPLQVAENIKAASYVKETDEVEKNFGGDRENYKRSPRKLGTDDQNKSSELHEYQGVIGRPGVDFPILPSIPHTDFSCKKVKKSGYYADPETDCQVFHICDNGRKVSFLCPNGTVFRQSHLICDWWFRVDCERSIELYEESAEQLANDQRIFRERSEALAKSMLKVQTTPDANRVVTERSFGPSTTIFNSESRLPERARYFSSYSKDESQVPAETASFVGNQFQQNVKNYNPQSTPVNNWGPNNFQSNNYQAQSSTTARPTLNQVANNNYQSSFYQTQSTTAAQLPNVQVINNFQSNYQPQYTTSAQSAQNADVANSQGNYQAQPTTVIPQVNWSQGNNNFKSGNYQTVSATAAAQTNWNDRGNNGFQTENYQSYTPTTTQNNWNQGNNYQPLNYQTPTALTPVQNNWNNQNANSFQTENYQPSPTTPVPVNWNNQAANNFGIINYQKQVTTPVPNTNWNQAANDFQSNNYQSSVASTTIQPDWNQESDTVQPGLYQSQQPYQQPTTIFPTENEQTLSVKESQVPAESASFVGHQNSNGFNYQPHNFYSETVQTNPPPTAYPVTISYPNDYSPSGDFSFVDYQKSPDTPLARNAPTEASFIGTTLQDYTTNNSTSSPSGETLIPNMINSLQTITDNNLHFDLDAQNVYPSQTHTDDELNSVALYFNNKKSPVATVASDLQFHYLEHTSRAYNDEISSIGTDSLETTTLPVEDLLLPGVLTQSTKEAFDKLFKKENDNNNDSATNKESVTTIKSTDHSQSTSKSTYPENFANSVTPTNLVASPTNSVSPTSLPNPTSKPSVNLSFAQGLNINRSSAELRELAAVFTRALTAYLDDPENFRKILAEVRPTEPSVKTSVTEEQEVLDFSDDSKNRRGKPTVPSSTTSPNLAVEINGMTQNINADLSTIVPQYTTSPLIEITSKFTDAPEADLPEYTPLADSEQLQFAGSQSFYSRRENSIEKGKTQKPATSTYAWTVSPLVDDEVKTTTLPPVYFTTTAEGLQSTVIVQRAKEMFNQLNASEAGVLMNVMKTAQANDTVRRLVLLLVNDLNKENSPAQTRNNIVEALLDRKDVSDSVPSSPAPELLPPTTVKIPFGQRLQDDGTPITEGQYRKRKGIRRRVVHRSRSIPTTSTTAQAPANSLQGANDMGPGLSSDTDARAVELLKSLYSIAAKWS